MDAGEGRQHQEDLRDSTYIVIAPPLVPPSKSCVPQQYEIRAAAASPLLDTS